jgi:hypothetical protein
VSEYLQNFLHIGHSCWMFPSCHKLNPWSTTSRQISIHMTLWELILMGIYEWTSDCTICQVLLLITDSTMKTHCWNVYLTARVLNPDLKINDLSRSLFATCFHAGFSYLAYSSTLKMETTCSSKTSADFQWTTWCYIPNDRTLNMSVNCAMSHHHTGKFHSNCRQNIAPFRVLFNFLTSHVSIQNKQVWSKESLHVIQ